LLSSGNLAPGRQRAQQANALGLRVFPTNPGCAVIPQTLKSVARRRPGVRMVRDRVVGAPQKTHTPLTPMVSSSSLSSIVNADRAALDCKVAGSESDPIPIAKVRVAGSNPVVRSREVPAQTGVDGPVWLSIGYGYAAMGGIRGSGHQARRDVAETGEPYVFTGDDPLNGPRCCGDSALS